MTQDAFAHLDAAYLLDALDPYERAEYEAHLRECEVCREQLELIRSTAGLLDLLDRDSLFAATGPDSAEPLPDSVLAHVLAAASDRRPWRRRALAGLVAAAALVAGALVLGLNPTAPPALPMVALVSSPVNATVAMQSTSWGTQIELTCWYRDGATMPAGYRYALTVTDKDGDTYNLGDWQLEPGRRIVFRSGTALLPREIKQVTITGPDGTKLLERQS